MEIRRVGVLGCGLMGSGIAQVSATAGFETVVKEVSEDLIAKGFGGIVINGAVRDVGYIRKHDFPVYAAGVTHRGPYKNGPGEINVEIALDGMVIAPGDLVLGDEDGLLCVGYDDVEAVYKAAHEKHDMETRTFKDIGKGDNNRAQYEKTLRNLGCEFEV